MGTLQLNIKDAEATRLVRELAELTGETQTEAVRKALRERLERERAERQSDAAKSGARKRRDVEKALAEIRKIQEDIRRQGLIENMLTDDDLYDERGLPKLTLTRSSLIHLFASQSSKANPIRMTSRIASTLTRGG